MSFISQRNKRLMYYLAFFFMYYLSFSQQAYFQQEVNYEMEVRLDDKLHSISATQTVTYINNSPSSLNSIYFHLWPNAYKNNSTALAKQLLKNGETNLYFSSPDERGYIDSLDYKVNGKKIKWVYDSVDVDICKLFLSEPLASGEKISITTPFYVKIPEAKFSRLGHSDQAYYMTQWYPKPAVYDNTGWHAMPYLNQGEFYSEFGSFDVSITLPANYFLAATGDRFNAEEEEQFLKTRAEETAKHIANGTSFELKGFPNSSDKLKTIRFKQAKVHDFAWFADKRFYVVHNEIKLETSGKKIDTWVFFLEKNREIWKNAIDYVNSATQFYSKYVGDYPYNQVTAIDGNIIAGSGMEYPNITVIGEAGTPEELDMVITHEVGHNWFYGILGSNERDVPFMDEGLNSLYEMRYMRQKYPQKTLSTFIGRDTSFKLFGLKTIPLWKYHQISFYPALRASTDQELNLRSIDFTETNYGSCVYSKSALVFDYLLDYFGETNFDKAMHAYYQEFKFKHPNPNDLIKSLGTTTGNDLSRFNYHLIQSKDKVDFKIKNVKRNQDSTYTLKLKNKTGVLLPFNVYAYKNNKVVDVFWLEAFEKERTATISVKDVDYFKIDGADKLPDIQRRTNTIKTSGLFKKSKPLNLNFLTRFEDPSKNTVNYLPIGGGNFYNGAMLGMAFHNYGFYQKRFEYLLAPMYAFNTKDITGFAEFNFNFYPKSGFQQIVIGARTKSFSYDYFDTRTMNDNLGTDFKDLYLKYYKIAPYIQFELKKKDPTSTITQNIIYSSTNLFTDSIDYAIYPSFAVSGPRKKNVYSFVNQLTYELQNKRVIDPFTFQLNLQHSASMAKISATLNYKWRVSKKQSLEIRVFAGTFIAGSEEERGYYAFRASGYNGWHDYVFDANFAARNERNGFGFSQFTEKDGALNVWTPLGQTPYWLASVNVKSPRIFRLPIKVFADIATCDGRALNEESFLWDVGLNIVLWQNIIDIYIPLFYSKDIANTLELNNVDFVHSIRFTFNIHKLAPKKFIQTSLF
jgi:hypothetical protein